MTKIDTDPSEELRHLASQAEQADSSLKSEIYDSRSHAIDEGFVVRRALPVRKRRTIGPWCFLDHFGPVSLENREGMDVAPHPHIGLQTVTWLLSGEVLHRDSLGTEQLIQPGQLNVMTSGRGIAHSEETPPQHSHELHGVQFWVALPERERHARPAFEHHQALPEFQRGRLNLTLVAGLGLGEQSPATFYSDMVGYDIAAHEDLEESLALDPRFEHGIVVLEGIVHTEGRSIAPGQLLYLCPGRNKVTVRTDTPARWVLVGGAPFGETVLMWWNFVARSEAEIRQATEDWNQGQNFGTVAGYAGAPLRAPAWSGRLRAR